MRGPHNIWRLIQTGATFERSGAMTVAMDAMDAMGAMGSLCESIIVTVTVSNALEKSESTANAYHRIIHHIRGNAIIPMKAIPVVFGYWVIHRM